MPREAPRRTQRDTRAPPDPSYPRPARSATPALATSVIPAPRHLRHTRARHLRHTRACRGYLAVSSTQAPPPLPPLRAPPDGPRRSGGGGRARLRAERSVIPAPRQIRHTGGRDPSYPRLPRVSRRVLHPSPAPRFPHSERRRTARAGVMEEAARGSAQNAAGYPRPATSVIPALARSVIPALARSVIPALPPPSYPRLPPPSYPRLPRVSRRVQHPSPAPASPTPSAAGRPAPE